MLSRRWDEVVPGDPLVPVRFPLTLYRLVMAAAGTRDFNPMHHNRALARAGGAADIYANTVFLQGMWERTIREYLGDAWAIHGLSGFRMQGFSHPGQTVTVSGAVVERWAAEGRGFVRIELRSETAGIVSVGPGHMVASRPIEHSA